MRRKINDEHEARHCLKAAERSGQTAGEWARDHGIDGRSLNAWRINMARRAPPDRPEHRLVELVPVTPPRNEAGYLVHVGDATIELHADFDEAALVRLMRALRAC